MIQKAAAGTAYERKEAAKVWWSIAVSIICTVALVIAGVLYTNKVARDSEQKWCGIVTTLNDSYTAPRPPNAPPLTATGQRLMEEMGRLRREFNC